MAQAAAANVKTKAAPAPAVKQVPVWKWSAKTKQGEVKSGEMEAGEAAAVEARLRQMGLGAHQGSEEAEGHRQIPGLGPSVERRRTSWSSPASSRR